MEKEAMHKGSSGNDQASMESTLESKGFFFPDEVNTVLEEMPPDKREVIERVMVSSISMMAKVSPEGELSKKITSEHIGQMIETNDRAMEHTFKADHERRIHRLIYFGGAIIILFGVILLLKDNPDLMKDILNLGLGVILGAFGGWGYSKVKGKDED